MIQLSCSIPGKTASIRPVLILGIVFASLVTTRQSLAYTPEDPTVVGMVNRGIKYLESAKTITDGETVLVAYTHYKVEHDESNPVVAKGIEQAKEFAALVGSGRREHKTNYECAVSIMLLCEISATRFRNELTTFQRYYNEAQMPHGGFGYPEDQNGDVSQTQYAILGIWTLDRHGFKLDYNRVASAIRWLMLVQDEQGPWPYHGKVPVKPGQLVRQEKTSMSMALAGAASLLIGADALRVWGDNALDEEPGIDGLPKAVKLYKEDVNVERRKRAKMPPQPIMRSVEFMQQWRNRNPETFGGNYFWYFYTAYTVERFESFLEIAKGVPPDKSPAWYNQIVGELIKLQSQESGGWEVKAATNGAVSTSFAILFLIRSTQKSLGGGVSSTTIGGYGFSGDVSKSTLVNGKAITQTPAQSVDKMLDLLEGDGADNLDGQALSNSAVLPTDPIERSAQLDRLERLVRGSQSWQARRVSAKLLGFSDELRVVPALIYALSDPDKIVRSYARDGLRFISRKFEGFGMPDDPTNADVRKAQRGWRAWYLTMRPGYVFIDEI